MKSEAEIMDDAVAAVKLADRNRSDEVRFAMSSPVTRRFILGIIFDQGRCGVLHASMVPNDPLGTAFNEGRRSVGLAMLSEVDQYAPDLLILARREQLEALEKQAQARATQEKTNG